MSIKPLISVLSDCFVSMAQLENSFRQFAIECNERFVKNAEKQSNNSFLNGCTVGLVAAAGAGTGIASPLLSSNKGLSATLEKVSQLFSQGGPNAIHALFQSTGIPLETKREILRLVVQGDKEAASSCRQQANQMQEQATAIQGLKNKT